MTSTTAPIHFDEAVRLEQPYKRKSPAGRAEFGAGQRWPRGDEEGQLRRPAIPASNKHSERPFRRGFAWLFAARSSPIHEPKRQSSAKSHALAFMAALAALAALAGCGRPFVAATPPGFVDLKDRYESNETRSTTADGVVIGARAFDNDPKGEVSFWARAVENRLRDAGGYALLEKRDVTNRGGLKGTQLRFGHDEGKEPHLYYITIFANDDRVFVLEAGGPKSQMERLSAQIDWSVRNFKP
jgi:hypothetical protein